MEITENIFLLSLYMGGICAALLIGGIIAAVIEDIFGGREQ